MTVLPRLHPRAVLGRLRAADVAVLLVAVGAGIRIWRWTLDQPLWLDEQMIALNIRDRGFAGLAGDLAFDQSAPLGWLWTQWAVTQLLGTGEQALRLVPLLFGIGSLVVAWLIGRRWLGPVGTVTLVGLCAVNASMLRYATEVKQYSGDVFWVFVLIGLAGWVVERRARPVRALLAWWVTAAVASWFSMAAVLATPGLAAVLLAALWWRHGRASAGSGQARRGGRLLAAGALAGLPWLLAFGLHYLLSLRYAVGDPTLTAFWQRFGFPPQSGGLGSLARWLLRRPGSIAVDPVGVPASSALGFWIVAAAGMAVAARRRPEFGALLATPVVSAFALAVARVVPLSGRLALWIVPALLIAVAVFAEALARACAHTWRAVRHRSPVSGAGQPGRQPAGADRPRRLVAAGVTALAATLALVLGAIAVRPAAGQAADRPAQAGGVDDRAAVEYLRAIHRPGDVVLVTASSWPAIQWYAGSALAPAYSVRSVEPGPECDPSALAAATRGRTRVLAYAGAPSSSQRHRDGVFFGRLAELGPVTGQRAFTVGPAGLATGRLQVIELAAVAGPADGSTSAVPMVPASVTYTCLALSR